MSNNQKSKLIEAASRMRKMKEHDLKIFIAGFDAGEAVGKQKSDKK